MESENILSVGIDIGTSTTQLIFSKMTIKDVAGFGHLPQTEIVDKKIIYRSKIYLTPLLTQNKIDAKKVNEIIKNEYKLANITPKDLTTGAVIITGESNEKENAHKVIDDLSTVSGDFVVAVAGEDLESILAGKGAMADKLSKSTGKIVANLDIGGGTTNICYFKNGEVCGTKCLNIGGRLVKFNDNKISYISPKIKYLIDENNLNIKINDEINKNKIFTITNLMVKELSKEISNWQLNQEKVDIITFSGGVALCMGSDFDDFKFNDIGVLLSKSIKSDKIFNSITQQKPQEIMGATVIGAGNYSMNISGSTIEYTNTDFPIKNIPIGKIILNNENQIPTIKSQISEVKNYFCLSETKDFAIAMEGIPCPSFKNIENMAQNIMNSFDELFSSSQKVILIIKSDIGKALGQSLKRHNKYNRDIICIDSISCDSGDYIDLAKPIANGSVIPVVVKTLVFNGKN